MLLFKSKKDKEAKSALFKSMFNASSHAKIIKQSARRSSEAQARLVDKYNRMTP